MMYLVDCKMMGPRWAWLLADREGPLVLCLGNFVTGSSGKTRAAMILEDWCIRHHQDMPEMNLVSMDMFVGLVRLGVATTEEHSKRNLLRILRGRIVDGT